MIEISHVQRSLMIQAHFYERSTAFPRTAAKQDSAHYGVMFLLVSKHSDVADGTKYAAKPGTICSYFRLPRQLNFVLCVVAALDQCRVHFPRITAQLQFTKRIPFSDQSCIELRA